jgi:hypothetical protein
VAFDAPTLIHPTVHLNGTSRDELRKTYETASQAVFAALDAVSHTSPNGRDYYPQGPDVIVTAGAQHRERTKKLHEVLVELQAIEEGLV